MTNAMYKLMRWTSIDNFLKPNSSSMVDDVSDITIGIPFGCNNDQESTMPGVKEITCPPIRHDNGRDTWVIPDEAIWKR
jgi:hypothetical protein